MHMNYINAYNQIKPRFLYQVEPIVSDSCFHCCQVLYVSNPSAVVLDQHPVDVGVRC